MYNRAAVLQVVKLMKSGPNNPTTAAIGDGANDVSMIQEAHVGLGRLQKFYLKNKLSNTIKL